MPIRFDQLPINEKINTYIQGIANIKEECLKLLYETNELSKMEKLQIISENKLFGNYGSLITSESSFKDALFKKQADQLRESLVEKMKDDPNKYYRFIQNPGEIQIRRCIVNDYEDRHITADLFEWLQRIEDDYSYDDANEGDDLLREPMSVVYYNFPGTKETLNVKLSFDEIVDEIYEWVFRNKYISFTFDW